MSDFVMYDEDGNEIRLPPSIEAMVKELKDTWDLTAEQLVHVIELANVVYSAGIRAAAEESK